MHKQSARAVAHAEQTALATAELLRFAREGASTERFPFGLDDLIPALIEALHFALSIETAAIDDDPAEIEANQQLLHALGNWLYEQGCTAPEPIEAEA